MPGFTSHYLFGQRLRYQMTDANFIKILGKNEAIYNLGLQGPDIFFYHMSSNIRLGCNPGTRQHSDKPGEFLINLTHSLKLFNSRADYECGVCYLAGFYAHYTLDRICHPYVYARTFYSFVDDKTYLGSHFQLETDIDTTFLKSERGLRPSEFKLERTIALTGRQLYVVDTMINYAHKKTYGRLSLRRHEAARAARSMSKLSPVLRDPHGIKKYILGSAERFLFGCPYYSAMLVNDHEILMHDPCNRAHSPWRSPWQPDERRTESFYDLISQAENEYAKLIPFIYLLSRHHNALLNSCFPIIPADIRAGYNYSSGTRL